jgi:outer membrane receptor protein involved in Fe transport
MGAKTVEKQIREGPGLILHNVRNGFAVGVAVMMLATSPAAISQEVKQQSRLESEQEAQQEVVVTGSRIARSSLESSVPITTLSAEDLYHSGDTSIGDMLNDLPGLRSTFSQSNSSRFLGTAGINLIDLRGLGTQRTLVLVNGRRHVGGDILNNAVSPDINTFPTDLIDHIDVVTGGDSAIYGSDAISGVVNFVLKKDFQGLQLRGQGGKSAYNDAGNYYASLLAGTNFMDGRGNIAGNVEYSKQDPFFASQRPNLGHQGTFVVTEVDPPGLFEGSDGIPDRHYFGDVHSTTISNGGLLLLAPPAAAGTPCGHDYRGLAFSCASLFQPDGSLVPESGNRIGIAPNGNFDGGNGTNNREGQALAILPKVDRVSFNVFGHLTVADAFEPFIEAKYVRTDSLSFTPPAFFQGTTMGGDPRERPLFSDPFLTDAARAQINAARAVAGLAPATDATRITLRRNLLDLGDRQEKATRATSRVVIGAQGKFADDWSYEVSLNYGQFDEHTRILGNLDIQRFLLAMDATRDASGKVVCRSQINPAAGVGYAAFLDARGAALANALLPGDIAGCVPLNPFGYGSVTPAMRNYLTPETTSIGKITQFVQSATVSGNTRRWFELPGGPIGVALGVEHRTEGNFFKSDDLVSSGITFYNALPLFNPPTFEVKEVFSEVRAPLLSNKILAEELTLNAAGRYADYKGTTGGVFAHNYGVDWAPVDGLHFRVGKARSVRAPNLSDLYSAQGQNFATVVDPCSARNIGTGSATRAANCAAAGIPASYDYVYTQSLGIVSGGNPNLKAETSDSLTAGFVVTPTFLPGFSFSADYFDIKIDKVITAPAAQDILNACYDAVSLNNQFCNLFQRAGLGGGPRGEVPFQVLEGSLQQTVLNYAKRTARGIDFELSYKHGIANLGKFETRLLYTNTLERSDFLNPGDPGRGDQILQELGDPEHAFNWNFAFTHGPLNLSYELRYIGKMVLNQAEDTFIVQGRPPQNADYADRRYYPSVTYHNVRVAYDFSKLVNAYVGIDNLANKEPPLGLTGTGGGSAIYDPIGRFYYAGAKLKF